MSKSKSEFNLKEELLNCSTEEYFYSRYYSDYSMNENFVGDFYEHTKNISIIEENKKYEYTNEEYSEDDIDDLKNAKQEAKEAYIELLNILKDEQEYFYDCVMDNITQNIQILYDGCWFETEEELSDEEWNKQAAEELVELAQWTEENIKDELNNIFKKQIEILKHNFYTVKYVLVDTY